MEPAQGSQIVSISKRDRQLQELPAVEKEEVNAPPARGLNLRPLLRTVQRKALVVVGVAGVVAGGVWLFTKSAPTMYAGEFRLLVEPASNEARAVDPSTLTRGGDGPVPGQDAFRPDYVTQIEILKSPKILSQIAQQVQAKYPNFSVPELQGGLIVQRYQSKDPQATEPTKFLEVIYQGQDPVKVEYVLKVTADRYLKYSLEERKNSIGEGVKFIEDQLPPLQRRVDTLQSQIQRLQQQYKLTDPEAQGQDLFTQISEIAKQQRETQSQLQEQRSLYANLQKQLELTPDEAIAASALSEDPNYKGLQEKIQEIDNQIAVESARFLPDSPTMQSLQNKRQNLLRLQTQETTRILGQEGASATRNPQVLAFQNSVRLDLIQKMVEATNQVEMLEVRNQSLTRTRNAFEQRARQFPTVARQYNAIKEQLDIANKTLAQLLSQRETLRVEAAQKQFPWELFSKPEVPRDPAGNPIAAPSKAKVMQMGGVVLGLVLGVLVAVLLERLRNIFYTSEDIKEAIPLPVLGEIPPYTPYTGAKQLQSSSALTGSMEEIDLSNAISPFQEAFDTLYANIRFLCSAPPIRSLAVCSATPGDGKSTVALNLAQAAANMGQRVLLVDANLRLPQIHNRLDLPNNKGLSDLLAQKLAPTDLIERSPLAENLFVLTAGQPFPNSAKQLGASQMQYLMEEFQATFDLVIYDTSHLLDQMDANFLAAHTDGILMVVAVKKTSRSAVKKVLDQLNTFRLPTLGIVANHVRRGTNIPYKTLPTTNLQLAGDEVSIQHHA